MHIERRIKLAPLVGEPVDALARDSLFIEMLHAFGPSGGLVHEGEVLGSRCRARTFGVLGSVLVGPLVCFEWRGRFWLPRFQFDGDLSLRPGPERVIAELAPACDGWALARWFSRRNGRLGNERPCDMIDRRLASVMAAARAARLGTFG